jgi:hypothetical protein
MNRQRVSDHLAQIACRAFCPGSQNWPMLKLTDFGLDKIEALLMQRGQKPDSHNAGGVALPIMSDARRKTRAYYERESPLSPVTPCFRDVIDCVLTMGVAQTRVLMKQLRRLGESLSQHCWDRDMVVRCWETRTDHARLSHPGFAFSLLTKGGAMLVRDGYGPQLISDLRSGIDPLLLVERALGRSQEVSHFLDSIRRGKPGNFGNGKRIYRSNASRRPQVARRMPRYARA